MMRRIRYLTAVSKRWTSTYPAFLQSFLAMAANDPTCDLTVLGWDLSHEEAQTRTQPPVLCVGVDEPGPIGRARARNLALKAAQPTTDQIVFFVDCDMLLPTDFSARVRAAVGPGTAYFPVCYSLYKGAPAIVTTDGSPHRRWKSGDSTSNGWWRYSGRGNCGFVYSDFLSVIGAWDEARFGVLYGREDDDVYWRAAERMTIIRDPVHGFFHQWHPTGNEKQNKSLEQKK